MNLLSTIIDRLNQRIEAGNIFDQIYGLSELAADGNDKAWIHYIGNGQAIPVTNFDAKQGTLFWAKRGKISVSKIETFKLAGCKSMYETRYSLSANAVVRKSHLPCDSADAQDWIASRVLKLISGTDPQFKTAIGVVSYEVVPNGYTNEIKSLPANYEWASVTIDVDINVVSGSEDGCYDTCATGDIPLPDFEPCEPCLTSVAVDGVTITGNGTPADPLVAIGGGGGTPLTTQEEGSNVSTNTTTLNFTGAGVTASLTSPGVVEVNVPGGGGGSQDLQDVTDIGNSTTNDIDFIGTAGLSFDNGARFRKGTTDAGLGGAKGTAQLCSISYELKWEAGRLYYMEQDGFTIRDVTHNFTFVPQPTDDSSKGYVVGSRWSLDDGTVYLCSDATIGAAVWAVVSTGGVTNVTATSPIFSSGGATPDISIQPANLFDDGYLTSADFTSFNNKFDTPTGASTDYLDGTGTPTPFPTIPAAQVNSDWNATSGVAEILNKPSLGMQGGQATGTDTYAVSIPGVTSYGTNDAYAIGFTNANTGASTLNINGLGAVNISKNNIVPIIGGDIAANQQFIAIYDGTNFQILGVAPNQMFAYVTNADSVTINRGQPVYAFGATGDRMTVKLANNTTEATSSKTIGLVFSSSIGPNQKGYIITQGVLDGINTGMFTAGNTVYVGNTAGSLTNVLPLAPNHLTRIGIVERANAGNGQIYVFVQNGFQLDELSDVDITTVTPVNNDFLVYTTGVNNLWKNRSLGNVLGGTTSQYVRGDGSLATLPSGGPVIYKSTTDGTSITGVASEQISASQLIPANTFTVGDIIRISWRTRKTGTASGSTFKLYINTTASLTGAIQLGLLSIAGSTNLTNQMQRNLAIKSATNTEAFSNVNVSDDFTFTSPAVISANVNWTVDQYIIFMTQITTATADTVRTSFYLIEKL